MKKKKKSYAQKFDTVIAGKFYFSFLSSINMFYKKHTAYIS